MIYKNYKEIKKIIITILFVITSLVMPNFVNASATPLVNCSFDSATCGGTIGGTATCQSFQDGNCIIGGGDLNNCLSTNYIEYSQPLNVSAGGYTVAMKIGGRANYWSYINNWYSWVDANSYGGLYRAAGWNYGNGVDHWIFANYTDTTSDYYAPDNNYFKNQSSWSLDYSTSKPTKNSWCNLGHYHWAYETLVFDHILTESERLQLINTGSIGPSEPEEPEPETSSYILYYGENPSYTLINTKTNLPVVYNICDEWEEDSEYNLILEETGTETIPAWEDYETELTNCSGAINFEKQAIEEEDLKYVKFSIYKDEEERIAESENFLQVFYEGVLIVNEWINILEENPLYLNRDNISTTSIKYASFLSEGILTEDTEICIVNKDNNSSITNCLDQAEEGISYDEIELDLPNFSTSKIITIALVDTSNNQILLESSSLMLIVSSEETIGNIITNQFTGTSTSDFLNINTHDIACSAENWGNDNVFIRISCSAKKFGLDLLIFPAIIMEKTINIFSTLVKNIFPFNIAFSIKTAWDNSEGKNMPTDLRWLLPLNENGDITLNLPPNLTNGTSTSVVIFGDTIFKNPGTPADKMFKNIRALSTYLLWGGFLWGIYKLAIDFDEDEIKNKKE